MTKWFRAVAVAATLAAAAPAALAITQSGTSGGDRLDGTERADVQNGRAGNDTLNGRAGRDVQRGGPGNDRLNGGLHPDRYIAGPGDDRVNARDGNAEPIDCGGGRDLVTADQIDRPRPNCEVVREPRPYLPDVNDAARALTRFGNTLGNIDNASDVPRLRNRLVAEVDRFEDAVTKLRGYRLDSALLNRQRAGLARTGRPLASAMRRFVTALVQNDQAAISRLAQEIARRSNAFQQAARVSS